MHRIKVVAIALLSATLAACSSVPSQHTYSPNKSLALNLAEAGGIDGLADQEVSAEDYDRIGTSGASVLAGAGWGAVNYINPAPGFSSGWGLGLGLLSMIRDTDSPAKHRQLVAWMPRSFAAAPSDAQEKMRQIIQDALGKTLTELGWGHRGFELSRRESKLIVATPFRLDNAPSICPDSSAAMTEQCLVGAYIQTPQLVQWSPKMFGQESQPSFLFKADAIFNGFVSVSSKGHEEVNLQQFYLVLSKHLPNWVYFYIPPKDVMKAHSDGNLNYPQVYYQGKMELFITKK